MTTWFIPFPPDAVTPACVESKTGAGPKCLCRSTLRAVLEARKQTDAADSPQSYDALHAASDSDLLNSVELSAEEHVRVAMRWRNCRCCLRHRRLTSSEQAAVRSLLMQAEAQGDNEGCAGQRH